MNYNTSFCSSSAARILELGGYTQIYDSLPSVADVNGGIVLPRKVWGFQRSIKIPYQGLGGVVDCNGALVRESVIYDLKLERGVDRIAFGGEYPTITTTVKESDKTAIYLGIAHRHWGIS